MSHDAVALSLMGVMIAAVIWLCIHFILVLRQRKHAVELAEQAWLGGDSLLELGEFVSLAFSYAGYQRRGLWWVWPHINWIYLTLTRRTITEKGLRPLPRVWVVDDAPLEVFQRFFTKRIGVVTHPLRFGRTPMDYSTISWCVIMVAILAMFMPLFMPWLPWRTGLRDALVLGGVAAAIVIPLEILHGLRGRVLFRQNDMLWFFRRARGGDLSGMFELGHAVFILTPTFHGSPFRKRCDTDSAKLYLRCIGHDMISVEINNKNVVAKDD